MSFNASTNRITNSGYNYDAVGNVLSDGTCSYTWDAENRMNIATCPGSGTTTYIYDAEGHRVAKAVGSSSTQEYVYDQAGRVISVYGPYSGGQTWLRDEIWAGSRNFASYTNGTTYFHHRDQAGSLRALTNVSGDTVQTCTNLPFGDAESCTTGDTPNLFGELERDSETTNDHAWFRYYPSSTAHWLSPDPLAGDVSNPQSLNRYAYVLNNPTTLTDPSGLGPCDNRQFGQGKWWCIAGSGGFFGQNGGTIGDWWNDPFAWIGVQTTTTSYTWVPPQLVTIEGGLPNGGLADVLISFEGYWSTMTQVGSAFELIGSIIQSGGTAADNAYGKALSTAGQFFRGRPPGQSFGACVAENASLTLTGSPKNLGMASASAISAMVGLGSYLKQAPIGNGSLPYSFVALARGIGVALDAFGVSGSEAVAATVLGTAAGLSEAGAVLGSAGFGVLVGSAANCASVGVIP